MTLAALVQHSLVLFIAGAILMALGTARQPVAVRRARVRKLIFFFVIVHGVIGLAAVGRAGFVALAMAVVGIAAWEGRRAWRRMVSPRPRWLPLAAVVLAAGYALVSVRLEPRTVAWLFLCTAAFDGFSQVVGQWLGRHPLSPRISPAKTVEGMLGGLVGAALVAVWIRDLTPLEPASAGIIGAAIGLASLMGDLAGSWAKRRADIKDFSALLPGQGGVIDRFNSFVTAMALVGPWL